MLKSIIECLKEVMLEFKKLDERIRDWNKRGKLDDKPAKDSGCLQRAAHVFEDDAAIMADMGVMNSLRDYEFMKRNKLDCHYKISVLDQDIEYICTLSNGPDICKASDCPFEKALSKVKGNKPANLMSRREVNNLEHARIMGKRVRDKLTGFEGVVTAICFYLDGSNRCQVESKDQERWIAEDRLKVATN